MPLLPLCRSQLARPAGRETAHNGYVVPSRMFLNEKGRIKSEKWLWFGTEPKQNATEKPAFLLKQEEELLLRTR